MRRRVVLPLVVVAACASVAAGVGWRPDDSVDSSSGDGSPSRPATLVVRVTDSDGRAATGATVVIRPAFITGVLDPPPATATPQDDGTYELTTQGGDWLIRVRTESSEQTREIYLAPGKRKTVDVRMP